MQQLGSIVVLVALVAAGMFLIQEKDPSAPAMPAFSVVSVPFTELLSGENAKVSRRVNYLITSDEGLKELWKLIGTKSAMPKVDFTTRAVVAVFAGEEKTGGHSIVVSKIEDSGTTRTVAISRTAPGEGCMTTQALTSPYQIVEIPYADLQFTHTETLVTTACN
jgi:hypothetical protein